MIDSIGLARSGCASEPTKARMPNKFAQSASLTSCCCTYYV